MRKSQFLVYGAARNNRNWRACCEYTYPAEKRENKNMCNS